jgi:hypothetical protein
MDNEIVSKRIREVGGGIEEKQKGRRKDVSAGAPLLGIEFLHTYLLSSIFVVF